MGEETKMILPDESDPIPTTDSVTTTQQDKEEERKREQTTAQINAIESEIRDTQPLTSELYPMGHLVECYMDEVSADASQNVNAPPNLFLKGACHLSKKYRSYRRVRGDGNCYYRAFLYALCEDLLRRLIAKEAGAQEELSRLQTFAKESFQLATQTFGYDAFALEMFQEEFLNLFQSLSSSTLTQADLHRRMNEEGGTSEYCTWYLRVLTACRLKSDPERFAAFLCFSDDYDGDTTANATAASLLDSDERGSGGAGGASSGNNGAYDKIAAFCTREVEPMGRECGMVQVIALAEIMKVAVAIEYLDGRDFEEERGLTVHEFATEEEDGEEVEEGRKRSKVTLLYRPGHYDILYAS